METKTKQNRLCFIYAVKPKGGDVFYIGSALDVGRRFKAHIKGCRNRRHINALFIAKAYEHGIDNLVCEVIDQTTETNRLSVEHRHIQEFTKRGIELTNILRSEKQERRVFAQKAQSVKIEDGQRQILEFLRRCVLYRNDLTYTPFQRRLMVLALIKFKEQVFKSSAWVDSLFGEYAYLAWGWMTELEHEERHGTA